MEVGVPLHQDAHEEKMHYDWYVHIPNGKILK